MAWGAFIFEAFFVKTKKNQLVCENMRIEKSQHLPFVSSSKLLVKFSTWCQDAAVRSLPPSPLPSSSQINSSHEKREREKREEGSDISLLLLLLFFKRAQTAHYSSSLFFPCRYFLPSFKPKRLSKILFFPLSKIRK